MLRLLLTDSATGSKIPIITLTWSPAEHLHTNLEWSFCFSQLPIGRKKGYQRHRMVIHREIQSTPMPCATSQSCPAQTGSGANPHIWKPDHSHTGSKAGTGIWAQTVKTLTFPTWVFTLPVVFAVTPYPLGGNHSKCHWPNVCLLICIAHTYFLYCLSSTAKSLKIAMCQNCRQSTLTISQVWESSLVHLFPLIQTTGFHSLAHEDKAIQLFSNMHIHCWAFQGMFYFMKKYDIKLWIGTSISQ